MHLKIWKTNFGRSILVSADNGVLHPRPEYDSWDNDDDFNNRLLSRISCAVVKGVDGIQSK